MSTTEAQYHSTRMRSMSDRMRRQEIADHNLLDYGSKSLADSWFKQAIGPMYVTQPADPIGRILSEKSLAEQTAFYTYNRMWHGYHAARCSKAPKTIKVSRQLYGVIEKDPHFDRQTNHLHFFNKEQYATGHTPDDSDLSVYVQIDPERHTLEDFFFC